MCFGGGGCPAAMAPEVGALVAAAIIALSLAVTAWLAAVIVAVVLFIVAGVLALVGKKEVSAATPPLPQEAIAGVKRDVATVKESAHR